MLSASSEFTDIILPCLVWAESPSFCNKSCGTMNCSSPCAWQDVLWLYPWQPCGGSSLCSICVANQAASQADGTLFCMQTCPWHISSIQLSAAGTSSRMQDAPSISAHFATRATANCKISFLCSILAQRMRQCASHLSGFRI